MISGTRGDSSITKPWSRMVHDIASVDLPTIVLPLASNRHAPLRGSALPITAAAPSANSAFATSCVGSSP
jgi:hypothetical protein